MANITTYLNDIKNAVLGKEVRGSIHDGIKAINNEVESTTQKQSDLNDKQDALNEKFKNLIINAGNSNAEVAASRGSYDYLPDRLNGFDEQFKDKANKDEVLKISDKIPASKLDTSSDSVKVGLENLKTEVIEKMIGGTIPIASAPSGGWTNDDIAENTIIPYNMKYFSLGKNKFEGNYEKGYAIFGDNATGFHIGVNANASYAIIPIEGGKTYTISKSNVTDRFRMCLLTEKPQGIDAIPLLISDVVMASSEEDSLTSKSFTTSLKHKYLMVVVTVSGNLPIRMQLEEGSKATSYSKPKIIGEFEDDSILAKHIKNFTSVGYLVGESKAFNVNFKTSKIIVLGESTRVVCKDEIYAPHPQEISIPNDALNYVIYFNKDTNLFSVRKIVDISYNDSENLLLVGTLRPNTKDCFLFGIGDITGQNLYYKGYGTLCGNPNTFKIDFINNRVDVVGGASLRILYESGVLTVDTHSVNFPTDALNLFVFYDVIDRVVKLIKGEEVNSTDLSDCISLGCIRTEEQKAYINGVYEEVKNKDNTVDYFPLISQISPYKFKGDRPNKPYFNTVDEIYNHYDSLMSENPNYITKHELGVNAVGEMIYYYKFTNNPPQDNTQGIKFPTIFYNSGTHGGLEKGAIFYGANLFEDICRRWKTDETLAFLRFNVNFIVIPILNRYKYENGRKLNPNNVDLNRNFPEQWNGVTENNDPQLYPGTAPLSELETQYVSALIKSNDILFGIDHHNYNTLAEDGNASWWGSNKKTTHKILFQIANHCNYLLHDYDFIPNDNKNLTYIKGIKIGQYGRHLEANCNGGIILESVTNIGGEIVNGYSERLGDIDNVIYQTEMLGNTIVGVLNNNEILIGS